MDASRMDAAMVRAAIHVRLLRTISPRFVVNGSRGSHLAFCHVPVGPNLSMAKNELRAILSRRRSLLQLRSPWLVEQLLAT